MNKFVLIFLAIFLIGFVSSVCTPNQININTASTLQLDKLYGVGEVKAQYIAEARPYSSVDELIKARGIGETTLEKIKQQGLACVEKTVENSSNENSKNNSNTQEIKDNQDETNFSTQNKETPKENLNSSSPVDLTPKDIKSSEALSSQGNIDYSKYSFLVFCVILLGLYILKFKKGKSRKRKNEWK